MGISIKNDKAEKLARLVASEAGESLTDAVIHSLEERLERLKGRRSAPDLAEALLAISRRCSALTDLDTRDADEILGYDGPPAKLAPLLNPAVPRQPGGWEGQVRITEDFDAPLPVELEAAFDGVG